LVVAAALFDVAAASLVVVAVAADVALLILWAEMQ